MYNKTQLTTSSNHKRNKYTIKLIKRIPTKNQKKGLLLHFFCMRICLVGRKEKSKNDKNIDKCFK